MHAALALLLVGCEPEEKDTGEPPPPPIVGDVTVQGQAGWDPITTDRSDDVVAAPTVVDAAGGERPYVELTDRDGAVLAWVPATDLEPGAYTASGPDGVDEPVEVPFDVLPYGVDPGFDAANVVGKVWVGVKDSGLGVQPGGIGGLGPTYADAFRLEILSAGDDGAPFRVAWSYEGLECLLLEGTGTLTPEGLLTWSEAARDAPTVPEPSGLRDLWLRVGFLADGSAAGGAEGGFALDLAPVSAYAEDDVCGTLQALGGRCFDCVGTGAESCATLQFHAVTLAPTDGTLDGLPPCELDLREAGPALSCDGGVCAIGVFPPFLLFAARRRRKDATPPA